MRVICADPTYVLQTVEMIKGLIISVIGVLVISRIILDILPFLIPGRLATKIAEEPKRDQERHPVGYWFGRMLMMAIGVWIVAMGMMAITS
jgi:hypothetical protein